MPLECVMILMDNSLFSRNGDSIPSRYQSQLEGITSIVNFKVNDNPETAVGLMVTAGKGKQILVTPTNETTSIFSQFSKIQIQEFASIARSIQIAQLVMKHRVNKNQHERIIIFVGSAIRENPEDLYVIGRSLRRNLIALDIVNICCNENMPILQNLLEIVNVDANSHLVNYQGGLTRLGDALKTGGILGGHQDNQGEFQEEFDPVMEMVLRISLEEERKHQEDLEKQKIDNNPPAQTGMVIEETQNDDERTNLLSKANEIIKESDSKTEKEKKENEYLQDPKFIQDILKELKIDTKDDKKESKDKDKKDNEKK